jgi:hypothetical protein
MLKLQTVSWSFLEFSLCFPVMARFATVPAGCDPCALNVRGLKPITPNKNTLRQWMFDLGIAQDGTNVLM